VPAGFGGRLRGKGPYPPKADTGPRRAAHPVHANLRSVERYIHADMGIKERALARTTPIGSSPRRYQPPDRLMAFLEALSGAHAEDS
jgi:hypothetical protein